MLRLIYNLNRKRFIFCFLSVVAYSIYKPVFSLLILYNSKMAQIPERYPLLFIIFVNIIVLCSLILINYVSQYFGEKFYATSLEKLNMTLFSSVLTKKKEKAQLIKNFNNDHPIIVKNYLGSWVSIIYFVSSFFFGSIIITYIHPILFIYLIVIAFISLFVTKLFSNKIAQSQKKYNDSLAKISKVVNETFDQSIIIKVFSLENELKKRFHIENHQSANKYFQSNFNKSKVTVLNDACGWMIQIGLFLIGTILISKGQLTFASLLAVTQSAETITTPVFWLSNIVVDIGTTKEIRKEILAELQEKVPNSGLKAINKIKSLTLKDIYFSKSEKKLGPYNIQLENHKKYLVLGDNGSGKTTLLEGLIDFSNEVSGEVFVNNQLYSKKEKSYIHRVSYVSQKPKLYAGTVLNNITLFSPVNHEKMTYIKNEMLQGYNHEFFSKSVEELSGGEAMLVSIARAVYKDSDLIILDEPTSSLDTTNRQNIIKMLIKLEQTIIASFHNCSQEEQALFDQIIQI